MSSDAYMRSAERDENHDNPLTRTLDPNPILTLSVIISLMKELSIPLYGGSLSAP